MSKHQRLFRVVDPTQRRVVGLVYRLETGGWAGLWNTHSAVRPSKAKARAWVLECERMNQEAYRKEY